MWREKLYRTSVQAFGKKENRIASNQTRAKSNYLRYEIKIFGNVNYFYVQWGTFFVKQKEKLIYIFYLFFFFLILKDDRKKIPELLHNFSPQNHPPPFFFFPLRNSAKIQVRLYHSVQGPRKQRFIFI